MMTLCILVDGSFIWSSSKVLWAEFYEAWTTRFPPLEEGVKGAQARKGALVLGLCGLTITQLETRPIRTTCGKPVQDPKPSW